LPKGTVTNWSGGASWAVGAEEAVLGDALAVVVDVLLAAGALGVVAGCSVTVTRNWLVPDS